MTNEQERQWASGFECLVHGNMGATLELAQSGYDKEDVPSLRIRTGSNGGAQAAEVVGRFTWIKIGSERWQRAGIEGA